MTEAGGPLSSAEKYAAFQRNLVLDAAIEVLGAGLQQATFMELVKVSGVPRATAYRLFPDGLEGVLDALWNEVLTAARQQIRQEIATTLGAGAGLSYEDVVMAGATGAVVGLCSARFAAVLQPQDELMSWLVRRTRPNSVASVLANYARRCARRAQPNLGPEALDEVAAGAQQLATSLIMFILDHEELIGRAVASAAAGESWADDVRGAIGQDLAFRSRVAAFVEAADLTAVVVASPPAASGIDRGATVEDAADEIARSFVPAA